MKPQLKLFLTACLPLLAACAHAPAPGSVKAPPAALEADGAFAFDVKDLAASRAGAVQDAERAAVLRAASLYLDEETRAEKAAVLEAGLLRNPHLFVARYKILSEGQDGAAYNVRLRVWVYHGRVASELRSLKLAGPAAAGPRAALALRGAPAPAFAAAFKEAFGRRSQAVIEDYPFASDPALLAGPEEKLLEAAAAAGADLLITASASAAAAGPGLNTGFFPSRAEASVKLLEASSGRQLLELSNQASGIDSTQAASFAKALSAAGELLGQETAARAARLLKQENPVKLKFYGVEDLAMAEKLKAQLLKLDASGLRLESLEPGTAVFLAVPRRPDMQELASAVLRWDSFGLVPEGAGAQEVAFSLPR